DYPSMPLHGCVNDANAIASLLEANHDGSPNFEVVLRTSETAQITRAQLRSDLERLFAHGSDTDVALFYFAGHGTENDLGGYIVTPDFESGDEGVNLSEILSRANASAAKECVIILDSCMSGALGASPSANNNAASVSEGVSILTAARAGQTAAEINGNGMFTELVCAALEGGAADVLGNVSAAAVYTYVEEALGAWDQRPLFKAHLGKVESLRKTSPSVSVQTLRLLPTWFPTADHIFPLDPEYEDTQPNSDPTKVAIFKQLQKCRDAKLVEAVDEEFLYFAAMNSTGCKLTLLGQRYRKLAAERRI
ncbi:caspase family protein, partial [Microbacterium sp. CFBP 8801]